MQKHNHSSGILLANLNCLENAPSKPSIINTSTILDFDFGGHK